MMDHEILNPYLTHLHRLEFVVTWACTGKCKHCSVGEPADKASHLDPDTAACVVSGLCAHYPLRSVMTFALALKDTGLPVRVHPAWLGGRAGNNLYNRKTEEIISRFALAGIPIHEGNDIFPEGNALTYLSNHFDPSATYENPYAEDPFDLGTISVNPDGATLGGNVYEEDISDLVHRYQPDGRSDAVKDVGLR